MASRKRPADWSAALSHERIARAEAVGERLAAEQQLEELQEQLAGVEAEREGLESQLTALGAEREAHAELERDLEGGVRRHRRLAPRSRVHGMPARQWRRCVQASLAERSTSGSPAPASRTCAQRLRQRPDPSQDRYPHVAVLRTRRLALSSRGK